MNDITKILNIKYPIIQGGMAWVADHYLVEAVSSAGGLGVLGTGFSTPDIVRKEIIKTKLNCKKPFGINIMLQSHYIEEILNIIYEENVKIVFIGGGNATNYISRLKSKGIIVIPIVSSAGMAKRMEHLGANLVVAEGLESGGHIGREATFSLIPSVVDAVNVPVIAAGGIADGRGMSAAFCLGASGIQMGTRFIATNECNVHPDYKDIIIKGNSTQTVIINKTINDSTRVFKNEFARKVTKLENDVLMYKEDSSEEVKELSRNALKNAVLIGKSDSSAFLLGQNISLINEIESCADVVNGVYRDFINIIREKQNEIRCNL